MTNDSDEEMRNRQPSYSKLPRAVQVLAGLCLVCVLAVAAAALVYAGDFALLAFDPLRKLIGIR